MSEIPWYLRWFGREYDELYRHRSDAEAEATVSWLIKALQLAPPAAVLDLACGSGRHSAPLAAAGFQVYGLDLSWFLLQHPSSLAKAPWNFARIRGDMRELPFAEDVFDAIFSLFTSFGYFMDSELDLQVLREASRTLKSNGWFVLDFLNRHALLEALIPLEEREISDGRITIRRWVTPDADRINKQIIIEKAGVNKQEFEESVILYSHDQLIHMFQTTGFNVLGIYGDYNGSAFTRNSPRLILIGNKSV